MRSFSLLSQKGGAGKTTLAAHLAVYAAMRGVKVALIDTDPQRSAADWWRARGLKTPALATCHPKNLAAALKAAEGRGFNLVIIDTPPRADRAAYVIAEQVDFNLVPCRPSPHDLRAIGRTVDVLQQINAPAGIVINAAPASRGDNEMPVVKQARRVLARYNLPIAPIAITDRPTLSHPMPNGRTYIEMFPDGRPAQEIAALWRWVLEQMGVPKPQPKPKAAVGAKSPAGPPANPPARQQATARVAR